MSTKRKFYTSLAVLAVLSVLTLVIRQENAENEKIRKIALIPERIGPKPGYDQPDKAQLHEFNMTKDPALGYPPVKRLLKGREYAKSHFSNKRAIEDVKWTERGPNNFGGRTRAVMFDPNDDSRTKVWAAGVTGGIWYNEDITDVAAGWTQVDDMMGTLAINNIAYDPNNTDVFYAGSGEGWLGGGMIRGNGLWKSEDAGESWFNLESTNGNDFAYIQKVALTKESTLLIGTRAFVGLGGLFRSTDGGETWDEILDGPVADIEIVGEQIYVSTGVGRSEGGIYKSTDDAMTFEDITPDEKISRVEIGIHPNHVNTVYAISSDGFAGGIAWFYRSDDAGNTWSELAVPPYLNQGECDDSDDVFTRGQSWYDLILAVHPNDSKFVIAGGIDLHRSTDAGESWESISYWTGSCDMLVHADQHNFIFRPGFPNQALSTNDGGVYYTKDITVAKENISDTDNGGPVFIARNKDFNVAQFYACAAKNEVGSNYFLAGSQDNGSHQFDTYGVNSAFEVTGGDGAYCFIDQDESDIQITSYVFNNYFLTRDDFETNISFGVGDNSGLFINPSEYSSITNTLFASGSEDGSFHRYVIGESGSPDATEFDLGIVGQITALSASPYDQDILFVATNVGQIYLVDDVNSENPTSTEITGADMPGSYISSIAIGQSDNQLLVTYSSYGVNSIWETENGGGLWGSKEGDLPDMPVRWALYNPDNTNEVLIATDLGVWSSDDLSAESTSWEPSNEGLANVRCDMIKYRDSDGLVAVATHGRGLYTSDIFAKETIADFYSHVDVAYEGAEVSFVDASQKPTTLMWDFGDGNTSSDQNPTHSFATSGVYDVTLTLDGNAELIQTKQITVLPSYDAQYTLADGGDFESNTDDFKAVTIDGSGFELGSSLVPGKQGVESGSNAWVLVPSATTYEAWSEAYLYTPAFDFSLSGTYLIEFSTQYEIEDEWDGFVFEASTDGGMNWSLVGDYLDASVWYNQIAIDQAGVFAPGRPFFSGDTGGQYVKKTVDASQWSGNASVSFRFVFKSDPASEEAGLAIDDFTLTGPTDTAVNVAFSILSSPCVDEVVVIENGSSGAIESYTWDFGDGAIPAEGDGVGPFEVSYSTSGTKTITLTASSDGSDIVENKTVNVGVLPGNRTIFSNSSEICADVPVIITIADSEMGVTYNLYSADSDTKIGDDYIGDGNDINIDLGMLDPGDYQYLVSAALEDCSRDLSGILNFKIKSVPAVTISEAGAFLTASVKTADAYQWLVDGDTIVGATFSDYAVNVGGTVTLSIESDGCIAYSNAIVFDVLSVDDFKNSFEIYPNPVTDIVNIRSNDNFGIKEMKIMDMSGRVLIVENTKETGIESLNIDQLKSGIYHLRLIRSDNRVETLKFVKL